MQTLLKNNICKCGREIPRRANSTIQAKECPKCAYEKAMRKPRETTGTSFKTKTGKLSSVKKNSVNRPKNSSYYMREADKWFSRFVRIINCLVVDGEPYCKDIITGKLYHAKHIDCGHYISRANMDTRYDIDNCWPQNRSSNRFRGEADKAKFRENIVANIGEERVMRLERIRKPEKSGTQELKALAGYFKFKTNECLKDNGIKKWW